MLISVEISSRATLMLAAPDGRKAKDSASAVICRLGLSLVAFVWATRGLCGETQQQSVQQIAEQVRQSHRRCLQLAGGWATAFQLQVEQDPDTGDFAYPELTGAFRVRWPKLYCKISGVTIQDKLAIEREAVYDFVTKASLARENKSLVQVTPYRHVWTAKHAFPLLFQYYVEASQYYFPEAELRDLSDSAELWLPLAFDKFAYEAGGEDVIDGIPCSIVTRPGVDTMWFAPDHAYVLCRRDIHYGPGKPLRERVLNTNLQEIAPGVWIPTRQVLTQFATMDRSPNLWNQPRVTLTLTLNGVRAGNVGDSELEVAIPDGAEIDDQIRDIVYTKLKDGQDPMEEGLRKGRELMDRHRPLADNPIPSLLVWVNLAVVLALAIVFMARRGFSRKPRI